VDAFADFEGTVISGGTKQGVAGIVGDVAAAHPSVRAIGYAPAALPPGAATDPRYAEVRRTPGDRFTAAEPFRAWVDLLTAGIEAADVAVLGVGGGEIATIEYRIGLALGARVGLIEGSGPEVDAMLADGRWNHTLERLPGDSAAVAAFIRGGAALTG
jgi:SLOG in TRPM, prokaryote